MVGFGPKYTERPHHRGSSLPSIHEHPQQIACGEGFNLGYNNPGPNTQVLEGAIVGGPDAGKLLPPSTEKGRVPEMTGVLDTKVLVSRRHKCSLVRCGTCNKPGLA